MKNLTKLTIFIIGACCLLSPTNASYSKNEFYSTKSLCPPRPFCSTKNCFDCNECNKDCTNLIEDCDTKAIIEMRKLLCELVNANCKKTRGCDYPPVTIEIYPAWMYDESQPDWKKLVFQARKNCCYNLSGIYNDTLSGIKNSGVCVQLFDYPDCAGESVKYDGTMGTATDDCLKWIDCAVRIEAGGKPFNDRASSFKLCEKK